ncbi:hypothetical protein [Hymenobacter metallilatus]|uniref:hypothetical protein n=1 Tax=Hymenobacter metallilatus TaxID=2493666 RepID=UPI001639EFBA|nr:hypothetical protein [Hymenobacter metallilatus]
MKPLLASLLIAVLLTGCTLAPRRGQHRPLSPDHEVAAPDRWPPDTAATDSVAPAKP